MASPNHPSPDTFNRNEEDLPSYDSLQHAPTQQKPQEGLIWGTKRKNPSDNSNDGVTEGNTKIRKLGIGKDKIGWNELPINILHLIFSYTIDLPNENSCLNTTWKGKSESHKIVLAIKQRIVLCRLRFISSNWKTAIDSHPFWPEYTLLLDPSRQHSSTLEDISSARLTPSTPSFPTLFHRSRHTTLNICVACRINHPSRLGLYPAVQRRIMFTNRFGYTPTCEKHYNHYCTGCFKEYGIESLSPISKSHASNGRWNSRRRSPSNTPEVPTNTGLILVNDGDIDENGDNRYQYDLICRECRSTAISEEMRRILKRCSRGGLFRGLRNDWIRVPFIERYINDSTSTCQIMAKNAIEMKWIQDHTRYHELINTAFELQNYEKLIRKRFIAKYITNTLNNNNNDDEEEDEELNIIGETLQERHARLIKQYELKGEDFNGQESSIDKYEVVMLQRKWSSQAEKILAKAGQGRQQQQQQQQQIWEDDSEEEEEEDDDEVEEGQGRLHEKWLGKLQSGCLNDWINDRIRFGFWVSPSDEVVNLQMREISPGQPLSAHTSFRRLSDNAIHPFSEYFDEYAGYSPADAEEESDGLIKLDQSVEEGRLDPFLPPEDLLNKLDELYEKKLRRKIEQPLTELVRKIRKYFGDDEQAEQYCQSLSITDILDKLNYWEYWASRSFVEMVETARRQIDIRNSSSKNQISEISSKGIGNTIQTSPKIELVQEVIETRSPNMADYGIKEISFISAENTSGATTPLVSIDDLVENVTMIVQEPSPNPAKRKSPMEHQNDDEVSIPEKKIRHSPSVDIDHENPLPTTPSDRASFEEDSPTLKRRKIPPSPETHHIDRTARNVSPPPALTFDLQKIKDDHPLDISTNSSMPTTPTPIFGLESIRVDVEDDMMGGERSEDNVSAEQEEEEEEEKEEVLFNRSETEESSHDTVGTMPITPEAEEWVENTANLTGFSPIHQTQYFETGKTHSSKSSSEDAITVVDTATGKITSLERGVDLSEAEEGDITYALNQEEEELESEDMSEEETDNRYRSNSGSMSVTNIPLGHHGQRPRPAHIPNPEEMIKRYAEREEKNIPFLPHSPPEGGRGRELNLGSRTNKLIHDLFWEKREILRECRCGICERSRLRELNSRFIGRGGDLRVWFEQYGVTLG